MLKIPPSNWRGESQMVVRQANFGSCFCINQTNMQIHLMGGGAQGTGSDEKRFTEAYAHFQYVQSSLTRKSVLPNLL